MANQYIFGRTAQNRVRAIKFVLTETILFLTVIVLQTTFFARVRLFGAIPDLCFVTLILISYFCGKEVGAITGIAAGFAADALGSVGISLLPVFYLFCGYVCGYFVRAVHPKGFVAYLTVLTAAIPVRMAITLIYICINYSTIHILELLVQTLLPEAAVTFLGGLILYYPIKKICAFLNRS